MLAFDSDEITIIFNIYLLCLEGILLQHSIFIVTFCRNVLLNKKIINIEQSSTPI